MPDNSKTSTTGTTMASAEFKINEGVVKVWGAYGVVHEDGGLSWKTYPDVESAKRDDNYRGRARIIRLKLKDIGTEIQRELSSAEMFQLEIEERSKAER